jgi:hypothetical protein
MGSLYDARLKIEKIIDSKKLDNFKTKGAIGLRSGVLIGFLKPGTPDDNAKLQKLREATQEVLGESI